MAHEHENKANGTGYEVEDASVREVLFTGIGLGIGTIIVCFAVFGLLKVLDAANTGGTPVTRISVPRTFPPAPRLQEKPYQEMHALREQEDQQLRSYGWVDKTKGTVRIPIDRAIDVVVQRGLPSRASGDQSGSGRPKVGREARNVPDQATGVPDATKR